MKKKDVSEEEFSADDPDDPEEDGNSGDDWTPGQEVNQPSKGELSREHSSQPPRARPPACSIPASQPNLTFHPLRRACSIKQKAPRGRSSTFPFSFSFFLFFVFCFLFFVFFLPSSFLIRPLPLPLPLSLSLSFSGPRHDLLLSTAPTLCLGSPRPDPR
jgi:hypothetical protein